MQRNPIEPTIRQFLRQAFLVNGEDGIAYRALVDAVVASLGPVNLIEAGYAKIVIDEMWEILRLRRIVPFLHGTKPPEPEYTPPSREEIDRVMAPTDEQRGEAERKRREMIQRLDAARRARLDGRQGAPQTLERLSGPREDTQPSAPPSAVKATPRAPAEEDDAALLMAYLKHSAEIERLNRLIAQAEIRRDTALRDLERYRSVWNVHPALQHGIVDAEFQEVGRNDLAAPGQSQSPQRSGQHRSANRRRKAKGQPKRAQTRARGAH